MSSTPRTTLGPGDGLVWVDDNEQHNIFIVTEDGQALQPLYGALPWHKMEFMYGTGEMGPGMTVELARMALEYGIYPLGFPGSRVYKSYDEATGLSFPDPHLEESV